MPAYTYTVKRISPTLGTDTIDNVQSFRTFRGRYRNLDTFAAGTFTVTCQNPSTSINLGNALKIEVDSGTDPEDSVWYGFINDAQWTYFNLEVGDVLSVSGVDVFGQYGSQLVSYTQGEQNAGDALKELYEDLQIQPEDLVSINTTSSGPAGGIALSTVSAQTYVKKPAIEIVNEIAATEQGRLWSDTQGQLQFRGRNQFRLSSYNFSDETNDASHQVYSQLNFTTSTQDYFTQIVVEPQGLTAQEAVAIGASEPYRSFSVTTQSVSESQALGLAEYLANLLSSPGINISSITCIAEAQNAPRLTYLDIGDEVTVRFRSTDYVGIIEGIEVNATPEQSSYTFYFSSADRNAYLILDNPTFGKLDENKLGF
jgi:hypothetical protein